MENKEEQWQGSKNDYGVSTMKFIEQLSNGSLSSNLKGHASTYDWDRLCIASSLRATYDGINLKTSLIMYIPHFVIIYFSVYDIKI